MNRKDYNDLHNEGGEGYVPSYLQTPETSEPRIWQLRGQRDHILAIMAGTSTEDKGYLELAAKLAAVIMEIEKEGN